MELGSILSVGFSGVETAFCRFFSHLFNREKLETEERAGSLLLRSEEVFPGAMPSSFMNARHYATIRGALEARKPDLG